MEILWLGHAACHDVTRVGTTAANLSHVAADYRSPPLDHVLDRPEGREIQGHKTALQRKIS